jgi:hypothetical protein
LLFSPKFAKIYLHQERKIMRVDLYEMDYSVSPGGVNCWEADVRVSYGNTKNYSDYRSAAEAIEHLMSVYPGVILDVEITSLEAYNKIQERENNEASV